MINPKLWNRIKSHPIGGEKQLLFLEKLQKEKSWSRAFTLQAVAEYQRFMYLTVVSSTPVTPSLIIDEVWHQHLLFSRDYWDHFCPNVLQKSIHHDPSNASEAGTMGTQFQQTQKLYHQEFGELPVQMVWASQQTKPVVSPLKNFRIWGSIAVFLGAMGIFLASPNVSNTLIRTAEIDYFVLILGAVGGFIVIQIIKLIYRKIKNGGTGGGNGGSSGGSGITGGSSCTSSDCSSSSCSSSSGDSGGSSCGGGGD